MSLLTLLFERLKALPFGVALVWVVLCIGTVSLFPMAGNAPLGSAGTAGVAFFWAVVVLTGWSAYARFRRRPRVHKAVARGGPDAKRN